MIDSYKTYCEFIWKSWLNGDHFQLPPALERRFDLDAAPEPYLSFSAGRKPLVVLTTNPGGTLPFQRKQAVIEGGGPINIDVDYASNSTLLANFYQSDQSALTSKPAGRRIKAFLNLADLIEFDGILQVEACPFHSYSLPNKTQLLADMTQSLLLTNYTNHLRDFLIEQNVIVVSAVSTRTSLHPNLALSPWLIWQLEIAGIFLSKSSFVPLVKKHGKITCAAFLMNHSGFTKALILMMGSNQLPSSEGLDLLSESFRSCAHSK